MYIEAAKARVYEQLKNCPCGQQDVNRNDIDELIDLVSMATCWTQHPCETFLMEGREEVVDLPDCMDSCDVFTFDPFYKPLLLDSEGNPEDVSFKVIKQKGTTEQEIEVSDYIYSKTDNVFKIHLPIPDCKCGCECCDCPTHYKLAVTYVAGYYEIPDCILPLFCEALKYLIDKNKCDCEQCQECKQNYDQVEVTIPNAADLQLRFKAIFVGILAEQYKRQLGLISLCHSRNERFWGFMV